MIYQVHHELFKKGSMLHTIKYVNIRFFSEILASNSKILSSGVHLHLAALCHANGGDLKTVNLLRSSFPPTNTSLPLSLTLPAPMTL